MLNLEIKIDEIPKWREKCRRIGAVFELTMRQVDIYFQTGEVKKKIRIIDDRNVEMIEYERIEKTGRKSSVYTIVKMTKHELEKYLNEHQEICRVEKTRELWRYKHTRIHLDEVKNLGKFLELETAIKDITEDDGKKEFEDVVGKLEIDKNNSIAGSYSDLDRHQ